MGRKIVRNVILLILAVCLLYSIQTSATRRVTSNKVKPKGPRMGRSTLVGNTRFGKAVMRELGQDYDSATSIDDLRSDVAKATASRYCYFDKGMSCPCNNKCIVDDRSCTANRDYFDHIYAPDKEASSEDAAMDETKTRVDHFTQKNSERRLSKREMRMKRKKLMMMSTWIDELLPDPYQGQDIVFTYLVNTLKLTTRGVVALLYALHKLKGVHFPKPRYYIH